MNNFTLFKNGLKNGLPIFLGYAAVSFAFGIAARKSGLTSLQAILVSATNLTSAGQFAALEVIKANGAYIMMAFLQLIVNLRYCLMSSSLSQRLDTKMRPYHRYLMAFGITDENFGVASAYKSENVPPAYFYGIMVAAIPGWVSGTALGAFAGDVLPQSILSALGVALYGMFIAIIVPPAKQNKVLLIIITISMLSSAITDALIKYFELAGRLQGLEVILLTVIIAAAAAIIRPIDEKEGELNE